MTNQDEVAQLPWELTCEIACRAMLLNISFNEAVQIALRQYLEAVKLERKVNDKS